MTFELELKLLYSTCLQQLCRHNNLFDLAIFSSFLLCLIFVICIQKLDVKGINEKNTTMESYQFRLVKHLKTELLTYLSERFY